MWAHTGKYNTQLVNVWKFLYHNCNLWENGYLQVIWSHLSKYCDLWKKRKFSSWRLQSFETDDLLCRRLHFRSSLVLIVHKDSRMTSLDFVKRDTGLVLKWKLVMCWVDCLVSLFDARSCFSLQPNEMIKPVVFL